MPKMNRKTTRRRGIYKRREVGDYRVPVNYDFKSHVTVKEALGKLKIIYETEGYREKTLKGYEDYFNEFIEIVEKEKVTEISKDDIRMYLNVLLKGKKLSPVTVNIRLASLRSMFNRLVKEEIIKDTPFKAIRKLKTDEGRIFMLTDEQITKLLSVIDLETYSGYRDRVGILTCLWSGLRSNELTSLKISNINFEENVIILAGEQNKNRKMRKVPITKYLASELKQLITEVRAQFGDDVQHVFLSQFGETFRYDRFRKRMSKYAKLAGIDKECRASPHSLRHTFAIKFLTGGGDIKSLQSILGHSELESTEVYLRYTDQTVKENYDKVFGENSAT